MLLNSVTAPLGARNPSSLTRIANDCVVADVLVTRTLAWVTSPLAGVPGELDEAPSTRKLTPALSVKVKPGEQAGLPVQTVPNRPPLTLSDRVRVALAFAANPTTATVASRASFMAIYPLFRQADNS